MTAALDPRPGERILEAGSGSGVLARMIAPRVAPGGAVIGIDVSPDMVFAAREYLAADPTGAVEFVVASAEAMPFPDGAFRRGLRRTLVASCARCDRVCSSNSFASRDPGGRVVVMDLDFETLAVDHPDRALTRRIISWRTDHHSGDNWSGRQLYRRMVEAGLCDVAVVPVTTVATDDRAALTGSIFRAAEVVRDGGAITPAEHDAWGAVLRERLAAGTFMAAATYFIVIGERV